MSLNEQVFDALYANLCHARPQYVGKDVILCPICLREIKKGAVLSGGVEHIVPRVLIKGDNLSKKNLGTLNQRCGITILCRESRTSKMTGAVSSDGCNGMKGKLYDRLCKQHWGDKQIDPENLKHRHGVSILVMAYLGAFQLFGYEYIFQTELEQIREQFDFPEERKTHYLDSAQVNTSLNGDNIVRTSAGHPFILGGVMAVAFRRFTAQLPSGHWNVQTGVNSLATLMRDDHET